MKRVKILKYTVKTYNNHMFIYRLAEEKIKKLNTIFSAILVSGPKYSGKSELCKKFSKTIIDLMDTYENADNRKLLMMQSNLIFSKEKPILFDE
jgi:predicted AAA+ superfamily ATPase